MARRARGKTNRTRKGEPGWAAFSDDQLLDLPLKSLKLKFVGSCLEDCLDKLNGELRARDINVRAHGWISEDWFSAPETAGIAFPFYLAHPRLMRLERKMMLEAEGATRRECMRILRHEAGHVVQYAFGLHRRRRWQNLFGRASKRYPEHYQPNPASKNYVQYLRRWYAQCHPDEDFAETFAVWLTPRSNWRRLYADWPGALKKLEYVDALMAEIAGKKPLPKKRITVDPLNKIGATLGEHYAHKRERYAIDTPTVFDRDLRRVFSRDEGEAPLASTVIRRNRGRIVRAVARESGEYPFALDAALDDMMARTRALNLRAPGPTQKVRRDITAMLTSRAVHSHYLSSRRAWFAV
ncbi:MAG: putative zinc-binding metallopeptidase [Proteobacteria bacterium]|nr:putative zinc-binding metallopeptidase [Pseudomonadota bacterium]